VERGTAQTPSTTLYASIISVPFWFLLRISELNCYLRLWEITIMLYMSTRTWCIFARMLLFTHIRNRLYCFHCAECPANFTYVPSVNGCYKVVTRSLEWSVAGLHCRSLHKDAHLLVINDAAEQNAVAGMLASTDR